MEDSAQRPGTFRGLSPRGMLDQLSFPDHPFPPTSTSVRRLSRDGHLDQPEVAEECAVALVYDETTAAVLMATPARA